MVLEPSGERRRSGSHHTPRSLTEPIVRATLRPVLEAFGAKPTPEAILSLKVLDPAMGSGAFLVEACRQLAAELVKAWHAHGKLPRIPPDEDEVLYAQRLVARRCLYGVDKNPLAANLAKMSVWLATLARNHSFTFLDHALRHGDSLVGLGRQEISQFHWERKPREALMREFLRKPLEKATNLRLEIQGAGEEAGEGELRAKLREADEAIDDVRLVGDLVIHAFFKGESRRDRERRLGELSMKAIEWLSHGKAALKEELRGLAEELREGENPLEPFHWEVEFPEVFARENPGFDAVVGNPPFLGGKKISTNFSDAYKEWLVGLHEESNSNSEEEASRWPDLLDILRERHREKPRSSSEEVRAAPWWQFWRPRSGMNAALSILKKVLVVNCGASPHLALAFLPIGMVYSHTLSVFAFDSHAAFALLQSRSHEVWARFFASTFEDRLRYTPTGCFETFAFPDDWKTIATLESAGRNYYEFRAALMVRNNQGLTATYNRFHDPDERSPDILKLRELNAAMDRAVLDAYGWKDLEPTCEFLLDYEEDEEEDGEDAASSRSRGRRKPWRYRWPDDLRDEVLARLLALNRARAEEERLSSGASERNVPRPGKKRRKRT